MLAHKFMIYRVRKYFELKLEWYKTNVYCFLLAYQQTFDGPGQSALQRISKQTNRQHQSYASWEWNLVTKQNATSLRCGGEVILAQL